MRVRQRQLPPGWYPGSAEQVRKDIARMLRKEPSGPQSFIAGIVPHAGWEFSGKTALELFSRIIPSVGTLVIIGGHLGPADGILCAFEDRYETPLGPVSADLDLLAAVRERARVSEDLYADNTVEVQLPFVKHFFPAARALGMRAPPSGAAAELGSIIARIGKETGKGIAVIGSTDLTHYGSNYGFSPMGTGEKALEWVRSVNDAELIECLTALDSEGAVRKAIKDRSACSAGGAAAAMGFAKEMGSGSGVLLAYATSHDVHPSESFVGYAAVGYEAGGARG